MPHFSTVAARPGPVRIHERARHQDRYYEMVDEADATIETVEIADQINEREELQEASLRQILTDHLGATTFTDAHQGIVLALEAYRRMEPLDALQDERLYEEVPRRQRVILARGRDGVADCEAGR